MKLCWRAAAWETKRGRPTATCGSSTTEGRAPQRPIRSAAGRGFTADRHVDTVNSPPLAESLNGVRILLVEDHGDTLDLLQQVLRHLGATVTAVLTARDAIALVADADVVVTDFKLPGEDGVWLLEEVNQQPRPVPVLLVSGFAEYQIPELASAPFARKLLKPIDPEELGRIIGDVRRT
jgi:CheY-like chemotaxis protein